MSNFGIMFHHFHDKNKHIVSQGSISGNSFRQMLNYLKTTYEIINADLWYSEAINNNLKPNQICLTFDDALACQYDVAYPILKELGITAFWFLYSSIYKGSIEKLEVYRHFRFSSFETIDSFYSLFFKTIIQNQNIIGIDIEKTIEQFNPNDHLKQFSFYTDLDKVFRYIRDDVLGEEKYYFIMDNMIDASGYDIELNKDLLWIKEEQVIDLHKNKHIIGLHSHSHPTNMATKTYSEQMSEYQENKDTLERIIQESINTVSYPCNSYNSDTYSIMNHLGIHLGFNAIMLDETVNNLHFPRKDHAYLVKEMAL